VFDLLPEKEHFGELENLDWMGRTKLIG